MGPDHPVSSASVRIRRECFETNSSQPPPPPLTGISLSPPRLQDLKVDLAGLQERLRAAKGLTEEMEASTETYKRIRKEIEDIDARNKELTESLEKLHAVEDAVRTVVTWRL